MQHFLAFVASATLAAGAEIAGCEGLGDDCVDGYMSLLQDSARLLKRGTGHEVEGVDESYREAAEARSEASMEMQVHTIIIALLALAVLAGVVYFFLLMSSAQRASVLHNLVVNSESTDEVEVREHDEFEEDAYSLAVALIVRDLQALAVGKASSSKPLRYSRLAFSIGLIALTIFLQVSILVGVKKYVTPQQVGDIRDAYDEYQSAMYSNHTYLNKNGKNRGIVGYFNASNFDDLDGDLQEAVCNIPLSQVNFISLVLVVWAITCAAQLKKAVETFMALMFFASTKNSMADALTEVDSDCDGDSDPSSIQDGIPTVIISGLTLQVKVLLAIFVFLPDIGTTSYILWLGSRWLVATNDWGNVISNAVALEFLLMLKCLLFYALVSERNKRDLAHTALAPSWDKEPAGYSVYFNTSIWGILCIFWVWYYIHYQQVLPDYHWDVHDVCTPWLQSQLDG